MKVLVRYLSSFYALHFARTKLANFHYLLLKIALKGLGVLNYYNEEVSGEEYFISNMLPWITSQENPVFFDVGANKGNYSCLLASKYPNSKIFAFEPHPKCFLELSLLKIKNFYPIQIALGSTVGNFTLFDRADIDDSTHASLYEGVIKEIHHQRTSTYEVSVNTLDLVAESLGIEYIDLLKIDTEGNELSILQGGKKFIEQDRIGVIQFEFNEMNTISHVFFCDFRKLLKNYSFYRLLPHGLLPIPNDPLLSEIFAYQNILAISKSKDRLLNHV